MKRWLPILLILALAGCSGCSGGNAGPAAPAGPSSATPGGAVAAPHPQVQPGAAQTPAPAPTVPVPVAPTPAPPPEAKASPLSCEYRRQEGETWLPAPPPGSLKPGPVQIRIKVPAGVKREELYVGTSPENPGLQPAAIPGSPDTYIISAAQAPSRVEIILGGGSSGACVLYFGDPPALVALDPATGAETVVGQASVDTTGSLLSPDGRWVAFDAYAPDRVYEYEVFVTDLTTGQMHSTGERLRIDPWYSPFYRWTPAGLWMGSDSRAVLWNPAERRRSARQSKAFFWGPVSPGGRTVAGFYHDEKKVTNHMVTSSIVLHDVATGQERVFPEVALASWPPKATPPRLGMQWEPDSKLLILDDYRSEQLKRLHTETGKIDVIQRPPQIEVHAGQAVLKPGPGGWQAEVSGRWMPVTVVAPDGSRKSRGEGTVVGWLPDGRLLVVRWPLAAHRRMDPQFP